MSSVTEAPRHFDLLIHGASVVDGTGAPRRQADVGVTGSEICFVGDATGMSASRMLDATGMILAPGFIDSHAHDDWAVLAQPAMAPKVSQGVTTVINGNCGNSLAPYRADRPRPLPLREHDAAYRFDTFADYLDALAALPAAVNVASLVGHSALRVRYMDDLERVATRDEIKQMADAVDEAMQAGALGLSTGTFYPPAAAATTEEIIAVGAVLSRYDGVYTTHMRDEGDRVMEAIEESAAIARALDVPLVVSHHKVIGQANFGRTVDTLGRLTSLAASQPICMDCYPYTASSSLLRASRLSVCSDILVTSSRSEPDVAGHGINALAEKWSCSREEALARVMPGTGIYFLMDEADVQRVLRHPASMIGSDGISMDDYPHPRLWGTFTRVLGHYSRELGLFPLETAVHKMTGMTARNFRLARRGEIRPGFYADLTLFDSDAVGDAATYLAPRAISTGISHVFVNGEQVWGPDGQTAARPGRCLRRGALA